jgi:hypothetical protein
MLRFSSPSYVTGTPERPKKLLDLAPDYPGLLGCYRHFERSRTPVRRLFIIQENTGNTSPPLIIVAGIDGDRKKEIGKFAGKAVDVAGFDKLQEPSCVRSAAAS